MAKNTNPLEAEVLASITKYLKKLDIGVVLRHNTGAFKTGNRFVSCGVKGTSDLSVELHNSTQTIWIEVKREQGSTVSPEQLEFLSRQSQRGNVALISHSVAELEAQLKEAGLI
jgi:hypothetical protein